MSKRLTWTQPEAKIRCHQSEVVKSSVCIFQSCSCLCVCVCSGTELTFNYNLECLGNGKTVCKCGAPNCSGFLGVRPKVRRVTQITQFDILRYKLSWLKEECHYVIKLPSPNQNNPPSDDKGRKLKRRGHGKRKKKVVVTKEREDECFSCGDGGQMVSCKRPGCPKVYHADCLNLTKRPAGRWLSMNTMTYLFWW